MKINSDVLEVLDHSKIAGNLLTLPGTIDRKLYVAVNKVLEAAGGKWNRKAKAHVFDADAEGIIEQVLLTGEIIAEKQEFGIFETPFKIAHQAVELADIQPGMTVLEPSAGRSGNLVFPIIAKSPKRLDCYEILEKNCDKLDERVCNHLAPRGREWVNITCADFLSVTPEANIDRVVMNPPFAKQADIHHVLHAFQFLKPGGRLVAIMSASVSFRDNRLTTDFRSFVLDHDGEIEHLPEGSFKDSGTAVNTVIVMMEAS